METVKIQVSPAQLTKLRKGQRVRIRKAIEGGGIGLLVDPLNYSSITRAFSRNKGAELSLSPSEISANEQSIDGAGIFGKKFDKTVERGLGKAGKKSLYRYSRSVLNPVAKAAILGSLATGGVALGAIQPELIPFIPAGIGAVSYMASDYLDNPREYQQSKSKSTKKMAKEYLQREALKKLNEETGINASALSRAGVQKAVENRISQELTQASVKAQNDLIAKLRAGIETATTLSPEEKQLLVGTQYDYMIGSGLYPVSGNGLYLGRQGGGIVGLNGGFVAKNHQALQSNASDANNHFRTHLRI